MSLMLDELITNIVMHGYGPSADGQVRVDASVEAGRFVVTLTGRAFAFDPLQVPAPDTTMELEEREIGGLGVHFVRRMADELSYRRIADAGGGANELRLVKRLAT